MDVRRQSRGDAHYLLLEIKMEPVYFNRDLSWLSFNQRVLQEAADPELGIVDRLKFLAIFSSNLDEFYSVRVPVIMAMEKLTKDGSLAEVQAMTAEHMIQFGSILENEILPLLRREHVHMVYNEPIPHFLKKNITEYFYNRVLAFMQPVFLSEKTGSTMPGQNKLSLLVDLLDGDQKQRIAFLNIPTDFLPRFYYADEVDKEERMVVFLDDVIKTNLEIIFSGYQVRGAYSFKITRNSELDLEGEYKGGMARKLEKKLKLRAFGPPTRFLYEPGIPPLLLEEVRQALKLEHANFVPGGHYHNLRDLGSIPLPDRKFFQTENWIPKKSRNIQPEISIFDFLQTQELLIHLPYHSYQPVFRFFNEAANDKYVREIFVTIYRVATDSQIMNSLISAARNGKRVTVFVELKARFDEANNLQWSKKMKAAGIRIVHSEANFKVHSKIALVKRKVGHDGQYFSLLSTGNLNENTARYYTDHLFMTTEVTIARELEKLFKWLVKPEHKVKDLAQSFQQLLVSPFNLQKEFLQLIDKEIEAARQGQAASIMIKINNLEEKDLIRKLYEASQAGVRVHLLVRAICCLVPGIPGLSENISIRRIVDRFLEHGRIFIFHNLGDPLVFAGSADWMIRNIYHRIEVCFQIHDTLMKQELIRMINIQWSDNVKAVSLNEKMENRQVPRLEGEAFVRSQELIYQML